MSGPLGGLVMLALAGLLAWAWWSGLLTRAIEGTSAAFTTPRERRPDPITGASPTSTSTVSPIAPIPPLQYA